MSKPHPGSERRTAWLAAGDLGWLALERVAQGCGTDIWPAHPVLGRAPGLEEGQKAPHRVDTLERCRIRPPVEAAFVMNWLGSLPQVLSEVLVHLEHAHPVLAEHGAELVVGHDLALVGRVLKL